MDLAKRAVACKRWRWWPGMRVFGGATVVGEDAPFGWVEIVVEGQACIRRAPITQVEPDMHHPATLGCLLALVREAWNDPTISARYEAGADGGEWVVCLPYVGKAWQRPIYGKSEAEALIAALEAAPEK